MKKIICDFCGTECDTDTSVPVKVGKREFDACEKCAEAMPFPVKHNAHMAFEKIEERAWCNTPIKVYRCSTCDNTTWVYGHDEFPERCPSCNAKVIDWEAAPVVEEKTEEEEN